MAINTELIDELLKDYQKPEDIVGENGLIENDRRLKAAHRPGPQRRPVPQSDLRPEHREPGRQRQKER